MKPPYLFDEFFASGREESVSPFLTKDSRNFGKHLSLKSAAIAACFLVAAFGFSFSTPNLSHLLLSFVYFLVGTPALIAALKDLKNLEINIDVLMTLAAFLAVLIGSAVEGALLLVLFELSHGMEAMVSKKAKSALNNLNHLAPKFAYIVDREGVLFEKSVREIAIGEHIFVKNGEVVPLDGQILHGKSSVNLVHLTGESLPVAKEPGDLIPAGAQNLESALTIVVTRTNADSTIAKIVQLITQAHEAKPNLQRWLDRFSKRYATTIIALTFGFALSLPFLLTTHFFGPEGSIYRSLAFLIAASPCALIIATPTAYLSAISACARKGILLKGGITLDALASCKTIAFDKTGTLTTGKLVCTQIEPIGNTKLSADEALQIAYSLERQVVHPIATAICKFAESKGLTPREIEGFKAIPGFGLEAVFQQMPVYIGPPRQIASKISRSKVEAIQKLTQEASESILAALAIGEDLFLFQFTDPIRQGAVALIETIKTRNQLTPVMLTGDHYPNAKRVGSLLGIDAIYAELKPEDKLLKTEELSKTEGLAMVGDGINDAPSLARATVGISMGKIGSAAAIDASDVVLLNDDLHQLSWLFAKSHHTGRIVKQNVALALSVICLATIPALLGLIPLWTAVVLHEGGTVLVGLNSLRLLGK